MFRTCLLGVALMSFSHDPLFSQDLKIVTVDSPQHDVLHTKTQDFTTADNYLIQEVAEKLLQAAQPYLPIAGLAAPQIGINKSLFIYSYDRDPKNLEVVINPQFIPLEDDVCEGWEGCLSVILSEGVWKLAKVPRYEKIKVTYWNLEGQQIEKILEGFAAKVFQHEYDHLQGLVNINRADAVVQEFRSKEELLNFMQEVKRQDAARYKNPNG